MFICLCARAGEGPSEKGEVLLRGVGTLRYLSPADASAQWQPDGLTIRTNKWLLGAGFLGAPPISLRPCKPSRVGLCTRATCRFARLSRMRYVPCQSTRRHVNYCIVRHRRIRLVAYPSSVPGLLGRHYRIRACAQRRWSAKSKQQA